MCYVLTIIKDDGERSFFHYFKPKTPLVILPTRVEIFIQYFTSTLYTKNDEEK